MVGCVHNPNLVNSANKNSLIEFHFTFDCTDNCSLSICTIREYDGRYDNLLYFFAFQYNLIQEEQVKR